MANYGQVAKKAIYDLKCYCTKQYSHAYVLAQEQIQKQSNAAGYLEYVLLSDTPFDLQNMQGDFWEDIQGETKFVSPPQIIWQFFTIVTEAA